MKINAKVIESAIGRLAMMKFFPQDACVKAALGEMLGEMCHTDEQVEWLSRRISALYTEWPGPCEVRAVASAKFFTKDKIESYSTIYVDGIPSENPTRNCPRPREVHGFLDRVEVKRLCE